MVLSNEDILEFLRRPCYEAEFFERLLRGEPIEFSSLKTYSLQDTLLAAEYLSRKDL